MSVSVVVALLVVLGLLGYAVFLVGAQYRKAPTPVRRSAPPAGGAGEQQRNPYRATSIVPGASSCAAVRKLGERRFLVAIDEVPRLPLPGCDVADCCCTYLHHAERRDPEDDRRGLGLGASWTIQQGSDERRSGADRRSGP